MNPRHQRSPRNLTINKVYPDWLSNDGVITSITTQSAPWYNQVNVAGLNVAYHAKSGGKFIAPFMYEYLDSEGTLDSTAKNAISTSLLALYNMKWTHLWNSYNAEYNPLHSHQLTESRTLSRTSGENSSSTRTPNLTVVDEHHSSETIENDVTNELTHGHTVGKNETKTPDVTASRTVNLTDETNRGESHTTDYGKTAGETSTRTPNLTLAERVNDSVATDKDAEVTLHNGKLIQTTEAITNNTANKIYGFNDSAASNHSEVDETKSNAIAETHSGDDVTETTENTTTTRTLGTSQTETGTESIQTSSTSGGEDSVTVSVDDTTTHTGTDTTRTTGTETLVGTETNSGKDSTVINDDTSTTTSATDTTTKSGTETVVGATTGNESITESISQHGNLTKSPAELLSIDRDFWLLDYFSIVFDDIDKLLTLAVYSDDKINYYYGG